MTSEDYLTIYDSITNVTTSVSYYDLAFHTGTQHDLSTYTRLNQSTLLSRSQQNKVGTLILDLHASDCNNYFNSKLSNFRINNFIDLSIIIWFCITLLC